MRNRDKYNDEPLKAALNAYNEDCDLLREYAPAFWDWLDMDAREPNSVAVRGCFYTPLELEANVERNTPRNITGYVLEYLRENGEWYASEVDTGFDNEETNVWRNGNEGISDDWFNNEVTVGYFPELGDCWLVDSCDWESRLGVAFDKRTTPIEKPSADGMWTGETPEGDKWRVRRIVIGGEISEKAKAFFRRNPDARIIHKVK